MGYTLWFHQRGGREGKRGGEGERRRKKERPRGEGRRRKEKQAAELCAISQNRDYLYGSYFCLFVPIIDFLNNPY
jgi:hypothetical protein